MSSEWQELSVLDLCKQVFSGGTPKSTVPEFFDGGTIPWVKTKEVNYSSIRNTENFITELGFLNSSTKIVPVNSIIVAMYGNGDTAGRVAINKIELVTNQACCNLVIDADHGDYRFIYYYLKSQYEKLVGLKNGGAQQNLNSKLIKEYPILTPPLWEQKRIGVFLESFDDRITLLRETNITLESIAETLFKSWFVDFDPVYAKAKGFEPEGLEASTAALFPDSFEKTELGLVPRGWQMLSLDAAYEINPKRKLQKGKVAPYLDMASVGTQGHVVSGVIEREVTSGAKFVNGDTLLARITPCLENGKSAFVDFLSDDQIGWGSTEFIVLRPKAPLPAYHGYLLARYSEFREYAIQSMSGTSGRQRVQNDVLGRYSVVVPSKEVADIFGSIVGSLQQRISANDKQAKCLTQLRDTLLPRLISGQLRLPEATAATEKILSEVI
ncbi:restriction endonuclease subunit S [Pseudomonas chlororaphis]|uniref:Type I restriction modification DNA specificity domain-containing protein n=1 Tax=Pseudomonas chlororaphis TaxID=587753 RepID=A0A0D5Y175_9PSED|nr:restriction endonuclease subunit S [Pseudomonas chlororaphis]AKA25098.1 hypothetical protein PCL1606_36470 [Pseudomonas chlororaphis]